MRKSTKYLILSIWALLLTTITFAQQSALRKANKAFRKEQYDDARYLYKEVWLDYDNLSLRTKARIFFRLAECNRLLGDVKEYPSGYAEEAIRWYEKAIKSKYDDSADAKKRIAEAQKELAAPKDTLPKFYLGMMRASWEETDNSDSNRLRYADKAFKKGEYLDAIDFYKGAYLEIGYAHPKENRVTKARILFQIAECYRMMGDAKQEVQWYRKALKANCSDSTLATKYLDAAQKELSGSESKLQEHR